MVIVALAKLGFSNGVRKIDLICCKMHGFYPTPQNAGMDSELLPALVIICLSFSLDSLATHNAECFQGSGKNTSAGQRVEANWEQRADPRQVRGIELKHLNQLPPLLT